MEEETGKDDLGGGLPAYREAGEGIGLSGQGLWMGPGAWSQLPAPLALPHSASSHPHTLQRLVQGLPGGGGRLLASREAPPSPPPPARSGRALPWRWETVAWAPRARLLSGYLGSRLCGDGSDGWRLSAPSSPGGSGSGPHAATLPRP